MHGSWMSFLVVVLITLATKAVAFGGDDVDSTSTTTLQLSTSTSTTTSAGIYSCGGVMWCLNETQCARCLSAINATPGFPHTISEYHSKNPAAIAALDVGFFETLLSTASCSTDATPPGILYPALQELDESDSCMDAHGIVVGDCLLAKCVTVY